MYQRYVSQELTHFVGRLERNRPDAQYDLLLKILGTGELLAAYAVPGTPPDCPVYERRPVGRGAVLCSSNDGSLVNDTMFAGSCVCFCDIPIADLAIHMHKYSQFALSFRKDFLVERGACPVFYVARDANIGDCGKQELKPLGREIDEMAREFHELEMFLLEHPESSKALSGKTFIWVLQALSLRVLAFVKGFDAHADFGSDKNLYMEREWRLLRSVSFKLDDVYRVILPERYAKRLRDDLPGYFGQVTYAESVVTA